MNFPQRLKSKIENAMEIWNEKGVYAISILVNWEENDGTSISYPTVTLMYNTDSRCETKKPYAEERWNIAFWETDEDVLIYPGMDEEDWNSAMEWFHEQGIQNVGEPENEDQCYDEHMNYIGKGPAGAYELMMLIAKIARDMQISGFVRGRFGNIPILVHDYEYVWYSKDATLYANPNDQAQAFFRAMKNVYE